MKNKPSSGTGMLSAVGLAAGTTGAVKRTPALAPPPSGGNKIRSPLPPPPNDPVTSRKTSTTPSIDFKGSKENARHSTDPLSNLSQIEVFSYPLRNFPYEGAISLHIAKQSKCQALCKK